MLGGVWLVVVGLLRCLFEALLFLPRYLLLERHDRRSPIWGARAEATVWFGPTACLDVLGCIECLNCFGGATRAFSPPQYRKGSTNTAAESDEHEASTEEERLNSFSLSSPLSPRQTLLGADGNGSEASTEQSCDDSSAAAAVMNTLSRWLRRTSSRFTPDERLRCGEDAMAAAISTGGDAHMLQGVFTGGTPFVPYSLLQRACAEADAREEQNQRSDTPHMREYYRRRRRQLLRGRDGGTLSCWFPGGTAGAASTHVPYHTRPRKPRARRGFIPPWYAVHAKAQLLLSLLDPLWRILTELFFMSCTGEAHSRRTGDAEDRSLRVSSTSAASVPCVFTKPQPGQGEVPDPVEEICFMPEQAARELWARAHTTRQGTFGEAPVSCSYVPTLAPKKSSLRRSTAASLEGPTRLGVAEDATSPYSRTCAKVKPETSLAQAKEVQMEGHDSAHTVTAGSAWEARVTSLHWLHGSAPPDASVSPSAVIVLLLCPSVAQGNEHGCVARRLGALCAALTTMSKLRREGSCSSRRRGPPQTQLGADSPDSPNAPADAADPRFASWHAAIPVAEAFVCKGGASPDAAAGADASLCRERVNVTVEDIDRVLAHLGRLRSVSRHPSQDRNAAMKGAPSRDTEAAGGAPTPLHSRPEVQPQSDAKGGARSLYVVGVGWSNASSPLLQYVMSYGAQSRMDGVICINHSASSNYAIVPETGSSSSRQPQPLGRERHWCSRKHTTPFHSNFLSAPAGAVRLMLLAARLHLTAEHLAELRQRRQRQQQQKTAGNDLPDIHDVAIWEYLRRTVGSAVSGNFGPEGGGNDAPPPPASASPFPLLSRRPLTPGEAPLAALLRVEAQVDQEMGKWWLDEVQAGNEDEEDGMHGRGLSSRGNRGAAPPVSSGRWHPLMSLSDWDMLLQSRDEKSAAALMGLGLPGRGADGATQPAPPTATTEAADEGVCGGHRAAPPPPPAHCASLLFEMAGGRPALLLPARLSSPPARGRGTAAWTAARDACGRPSPSPSPDLAMAALRYHSASSAHLVSLIHVPTLFVHARDDEMAPLSTLPMRVLAKSPCVVTVLTRRGGYGVFLEGISTLHALPQLTLQERERALDTNTASDGAASRMPSKTRQWLPRWTPRRGGGTGTAPATATHGSCFAPSINSANSNNHKTKTGVRNEVETVFVIEHTTWLERLVVEFIAAALIV
ncbi:putative phospholipid-transporting ATPase 1-like protein [Trypanosoma conorhini]|uniref:Putative phospholipid-transporting ATPase 1-like protein n=1 Tax=Trypanosoma conorhini TaxID=83891 RepID=A0A3R7MTZ8_9TRYP|nr:putative phospholipid-transporting ATPase 1-like protein [Trypanosoma conorhini]RNF20674.1 putative phospholipid-transporting ATPase 1-like protein [Trypanosoma conorhini]